MKYLTLKEAKKELTELAKSPHENFDPAAVIHKGKVVLLLVSPHQFEEYEKLKKEADAPR